MRGLQQLERRLRSRGLFLIEPDGQDGRLCQDLAILHQLKLNNASTAHGLLPPLSLPPSPPPSPSYDEEANNQQCTDALSIA